MQSNTAVALFTKMKMLYEKDQKFLSFPAGSVSWKASHFSFLDMDTSTAQGLEKSLQLAANFAASFNFIAETSAVLSYDDRNIWDVYQQILEQRILATGQQNAADQTRMQQLRDYLFNPVIAREDGSLISRQDNYDLYQSLYFEILNEYNNQRITATYSTDQAVKDTWAANEPVLKAKVDRAMSDFVLKGLKAEVKNAADELLNLSFKGPFTTWEKYRDDFDRSKFTQTELGGAVDDDFYATLFYPADFYQPASSSWTHFKLIKSEINALCKQAPPELSGFNSSVTVNAISADIAYVDIKRPWLHTEIFDDRGWKLPQYQEALSDGNMPAKGRMPALPVAIILARNIRVELENAGTTPPVKHLLNPAIFANFSMAQPIRAVPNPKSASITANPVAASAQLSDVRRMSTVMPKVAPVPVKTQATGIPPVNPQLTVQKAVNIQRLTQSKPLVSNAPFINKNLALKKIGFLKFQSLKKDISQSQTPAPESEFEIVAFVCQKVPMCPNPLAGLNWL